MAVPSCKCFCFVIFTIQVVYLQTKIEQIEKKPHVAPQDNIELKRYKKLLQDLMKDDCVSAAKELELRIPKKKDATTSSFQVQAETNASVQLPPQAIPQAIPQQVLPFAIPQSIPTVMLANNSVQPLQAMVSLSVPLPIAVANQQQYSHFLPEQSLVYRDPYLMQVNLQNNRNILLYNLDDSLVRKNPTTFSDQQAAQQNVAPWQPPNLNATNSLGKTSMPFAQQQFVSLPPSVSVQPQQQEQAQQGQLPSIQNIFRRHTDDQSSW